MEVHYKAGAFVQSKKIVKFPKTIHFDTNNKKILIKDQVVRLGFVLTFKNILIINYNFPQ